MIKYQCFGRGDSSVMLPEDTVVNNEVNRITPGFYDVEFSSLFLSLNYSSNTNTFGRFSQFVKQPSFSPSVMYFSKYGFDISGSGYWIENSDDSLSQTTSELDLSIGYNIEIIKNLTIYAGYSHFFYNEKANTLKSDFSDDISLYGYYQLKKLITGVSANYLFGTDNTFYFTFHNSLTFSKEKVLFRNSSLDFFPGIDISFSTQLYYVDYFWESLNASSSLRNFLREHPDIRTRYYELRTSDPDLTSTEILNIISLDYIQEKEEFRLGNIGIYFPVSYMAGNLILDFTLLTYFPVNQPDYFNNDIQVYFNLGISYFIDINW